MVTLNAGFIVHLLIHSFTHLKKYVVYYVCASHRSKHRENKRHKIHSLPSRISQFSGYDNEIKYFMSHEKKDIEKCSQGPKGVSE